VNSLKPLAQGVIADLRARRLLPVAILLALALVAVPVLLSRSPDPVAVDGAAVGVEPVDTGGLPGPAEALGEKPLVTLASLESSSDLDSFSARDPFKPLRTLAAIDANPGVATDVAFAATAGTAAAEDSGGIGGGSTFAGAVGGDPSTGEDTGGDTGGGAPSPSPTPSPAPEPTPAPAPAPERKFTYAVDLTYDGPESTPRTYRNLPRLSMLPHEASPMLIFLGVGADVNDVVFLVDASLRASSEGEGTCSPSPQDCATIAIEPGEQQVFLDDRDRRYVLQVDQIREVALVTASRESDGSENNDNTAGTSSTADIGAPVRRFLPQLLTELLVIGGQQ